FPVVVREPGSQLDEPLGVQPLERLAGAAMELSATRGEQRRLGDILRQRVLEGIYDLVARRALEEKLEARELAEMGLERAGAVPDCREETRGELAAEDRRGLQDALVRLVEPVDARAEDAMHGIRDRKACDEALVADRPRQLLEKERVALGFVEDQ